MEAPPAAVEGSLRTPPEEGSAAFRALLSRDEPVLALAPMQDVTDLPFWGVLARHGGPDVYWTEYFRVHSTSTLDAPIVRSLVENPTGRPAIAQLIGNDPVALAKAARQLQEYPVAAVDLNLGCPAPVVYRKCAGGGLLREPQRIDAILGALRQAVTRVPFTVKTRVGFSDDGDWDALLALFARHRIDLLTVHGRTVTDMYRSEVRCDWIARAVRAMPCPVLANGNVHSPPRAAQVLRDTGARGLMIGRGCIRNPWIFDQIRDYRRTGGWRQPTGHEVLDYITHLYEVTRPTAGFRERLQVEKMKKYMNFIGEGVSPEFLHRIRRATTREEFFGCCREFLDHDGPMPLLPPALPAHDSTSRASCPSQ
jgi:tRNA-dihydrouridine synthase